MEFDGFSETTWQVLNQIELRTSFHVLRLTEARSGARVCDPQQANLFSIVDLFYDHVGKRRDVGLQENEDSHHHRKDDAVEKDET